MRAERQIQRAAAPLPPFSTPRYSLRQHLGQWLLTFEGRHALLKHQQGMAYVAYLLIHPPEEPLHALALALRAQDSAAPASPTPTPPPGPCQPSTGKTIPVEGQARPDPFELQLAEAREARAIYRLQLELEALLDDDTQIEPVKAEAERELEAIYKRQERDLEHLQELARAAVRIVRPAIERVQRRLSLAVDLHGRPDPVLRAFAAHLEHCLLLASTRCSAVPGCFGYQPPAGVVWGGIKGTTDHGPRDHGLQTAALFNDQCSMLNVH